jgi:uncharacterized protein YeaO (DUF488 family)
MVDKKVPSGYDEHKLHIDMWARDALPSNRALEILQTTENWSLFEEVYFKELDKEKDLPIHAVVDKARRGTVTLLYDSGNKEQNNATAIRDYLISNEDVLLKKAA